ncbi:MAG: hypothetical protein C0631_12435 [Sedimenticola sp.]|nr:MAG: hypothetical protein C0631_12435 [Sedimenticola sp.]
MKPSEKTLAAALDLSRHMRAEGEDPHSLAKCLIYLHERNRGLEKMLKHLEYFLQFGMPAEEHARLLKLVEEMRAQDQYEKGGDEVGFGL